MHLKTNLKSPLIQQQRFVNLLNIVGKVPTMNLKCSLVDYLLTSVAHKCVYRDSGYREN